MSGRFLFLAFLCIGVAACPGRATREPSAHLLLERVSPDPEKLVDVPAMAHFCDRDGILTITGIGRPWSAALAMRTAWPPSGRYTVDSAIGGIGTAALAARVVRDSAPPALVARAGSVEMDSGNELGGHFSVTTGTDSAAVSLSGRFSIARRDSTGCPAP